LTWPAFERPSAGEPVEGEVQLTPELIDGLQRVGERAGRVRVAVAGQALMKIAPRSTCLAFHRSGEEIATARDRLDEGAVRP
jgi:hypothetical protein